MRQVAIIVLLWGFSALTYALPGSVAFYYGSHVPVKKLQKLGAVIVEPAFVPDPKQDETKQSHWYAYVSIGEVNPNRSYFKQIKPSWILGENGNWGSKIIDQSNPQWREFLVNTVLKDLWAAGYRGFFLDTMDSYQLIAKSEEDQEAQKRGLILLIKSIKKNCPGAKLILNRGFELLPEIHGEINGVAAESLYHRYNFELKTYEDTSKSDQEWLRTKLKEAKGYGLKVFVIDYMSLHDPQKAQADANELAAEGFIPWVSEINLTTTGVSSQEKKAPSH